MQVCEDDEVWGCNTDGTERMLLQICDTLSTCEAGACLCIPNCIAKSCGDDGCGGSCGSCGDTGACMADFSCCDKACGDRQCGDDACGGTCGSCGADVCLTDTGMCCTPDCLGRTCGDDGCGGSCGECDAGLACPLNGQCECEPSCEGVVCDVDSCGGLCGDCYAVVADDGTTETAYGYTEPPSDDATAVACMVRVHLPHTHMRLTSFAAGWMYGLWDLQLPFELVVAPADAFICQQGDDDAWWLEACEAPESALTTLASLLPAPPYELQPAEELGEHVMPASEIFIGARFPITEYPIYVCPMDSDGTGQDSFMFPVMAKDGVPTMSAAALKAAEHDVGAIPFRFEFALTDESKPVTSELGSPPELPDAP